MSELALKLIAENKAAHARGEDATRLDLGRCGMTEVPEEIGECVWLEELILSDSWNEIVFQIKQWIYVKGPNREGVNKVNFLPLALSRLRLLKKFVFSGTQVQDLNSLAALENLQILYCSNTPVSDLSPLTTLPNLQRLDCSNTRASDLSPLSTLENLQILYASYTQVSDLSPLATLDSLQLLYCSHIPVSDLSPLAALDNLQLLDCSNTLISDLTPLLALGNLQLLGCSSTQVGDLYPILPFIKRGIKITLHTNSDIGEFSFQSCPLTNPPIEVVKQGNAAILQYFAEKERTGTEKSLEAKVVLIGEGQAGKTSLRTRLLHPGQPLPTKQDRTKGLDIEIEKYRYPLASGETMRLNVFDFGGQDHYKPLHQFFYSKNTLYVLVSKNGDAATNDFDFWFETARLFGQNSPVLLVHNLFGDVKNAFNRSKYDRFGDILKESTEVNLADFADRRWDDVRSHLEHFAARLPHVHEEIPKSWANIRRALAERRDEQVLPLDEYLRLCALPENGGMDEARALFCSAYLHDIGVILHYQDDPDLREHVIVKNEWATDAAYRVIDDPEIGDRHGHFFRQTDLPRIWCLPEYKSLRPQLLELMKRFRLCYPLKAEGEFIAPQLLPPRPPDGYAWQPQDDLVLYVEYEFMPLGLLSQLIVECHLLIAEERRLVWRDGAVLELPGGAARAEILLQKRGGKQTIGIRAQGRKRRDLMTVIDMKLEELHRPFGTGLRVEKKIPCVCERCAKTEDDKWFFNLSELENRRAAGIGSKECEKSYKAVSIHDLLGNVYSEEVRQTEAERAKFKTVKIFLASSEELLEDRDQFEIFLSRENDYLLEKGIRLQLLRWENFLDAVSATRLQDEYNEALSACDLVVCLLWTKVGKYTAEEFDTALGQFRGTGRPRIFTYFKDTPVKPSQMRDNSLNDFKARLSDIGHFWTRYESIGDLKHHFGEQLKKLGITV